MELASKLQLGGDEVKKESFYFQRNKFLINFFLVFGFGGGGYYFFYFYCQLLTYLLE